MTKTTQDQFVIKGLAQWAKLGTPNEEGFFTLDISGLDKETEKKLKDLGVTIKNKDKHNAEKNEEDGGNRSTDTGNFVTLKTKFQPTIVDSSKNPFDTETLIGNGSKVAAIVRTYEYTNKRTKAKGTGLGLQKLQVVELKEYQGKGNSGLELFDTYGDESLPF